ncbi:MAG TPA: GYDIA family GHMP kinase [Bacteroidales bacterium]
MLKKWFSNGKLMLTGEYAVLFGAKALATPLQVGQSLEITEEEGRPSLIFSTEVLGRPWFRAEFSTDFFEILDANESSSACYLQELLGAARLLNPSFLRKKERIYATSKIGFDITWGLGSSSSLISNISWWANVDPYELNRLVSAGSGYDIACARSNTALFYSLSNSLPTIESVNYVPKYAEQTWFVYLGNKLATEANLSENMGKLNPKTSEIAEISNISSAFLNASSVSEISDLMQAHERIIAGILDKSTIQSQYFQDFRGTIKSLGAWGGDFCMAVSDDNESYVKKYFEQKGLRTVLSFNELSI